MITGKSTPPLPSMTEIPLNRSSCCFIDDTDNDESSLTLSKLNRSSIISLRSSMSSSSGYASSPTRHYAVRFGHYHHNRLPHFLESCFLCRKPLAGDSDVFMYRGDTPFCSEECRLEQIEMDEAKDRRRNVSMISGLQTTDTDSNKSDRFSCRTTGTIVAA